MILALQTTTFAAHGGIPAYNRILCRALNELGVGVTASEKRILIATDQRDPVAAEAKNFANLSLEAFDGNRLAMIQRFLQLALTRKFDLALIGHVNYGPLGLILKKFQPRVRYGVFLYGIESWRSLSGLRRRALQRADFLIAISKTTMNATVAANHLDANRVYLLPNALNWPDEQATLADRAGKGTRLLSVCRLEESERYKGVDVVIKALAKARLRVPDLSYLVVGSGSDLERHKLLAREGGVDDIVTFAGSVNDEALRKHYRECDIFLMPSDAEGFGFVFLEAMHNAKPIVAANSGATPEVVKDRETGVLVDYGNVEQLANAITLLSLDAGLRRRLGIAGQQRLRDNFSFDHFKRRLEEILSAELTASVAKANAHRELRTYLSRPGSSL